VIAGLILAGGEARRMDGLDKPLLHIAGVTVLDRIAACLCWQTGCLALSANGDPARFGASGLVVLADAVPGLGPLAGVLSGLDWAAAEGCDALLTVPGDTPFIPGDLASRLSPAPSVAVSGGRVHHAVALWPVSCRGALAAHLQSGIRSVFGFARTLPMREVEFPAVPVDPFFNINTPADLDLAQSMAGLLTDPPSPPIPPGG
jgi:molybdopterin-guanine dinucleotide biosynthesis protein A